MKLIAVATVVFIWGAILLFGVSHGQPELGHRVFTERGLTAGGRVVQLDFLVRADDAAQARRAIQAATAQLTGGHALGQDDGTASAAFVAWGWQWDAAELPVPVAYNPAGATTATEPAVETALATWSGVEGSRFAFRYAGQTAAVPGVARGEFDGVNAVGWQSLSCLDGCVLAVTSKAPGVHEADIVLNSDPLAHIGAGAPGIADIETVVLHELGHMAGLEHACEPLLGSCSSAAQGAVMFPSYQGIHRTLGDDDRAAMVGLYPASGEPQPAPVDPLPLSSSALTVDLTPGWNLRVLPAGPLGPTLDALPCVSAVYAWTARTGWASWVGGAAPVLNSLTQAAAGTAYWIEADAACSAKFTTFS